MKNHKLCQLSDAQISAAFAALRLNLYHRNSVSCCKDTITRIQGALLVLPVDSGYRADFEELKRECYRLQASIKPSALPFDDYQ